MQKAEAGLCLALEPIPVGTHCFEQTEGTHHIGLNKVFRAVDGAVHMAFCRKVHHGAWLVLGQQTGHGGTVTNVCLHKDVAHISLQGSKVFQVACIGELIHIDHRLVMVCQPVQNKIGANKTRTASYKNHGKKLSVRYRQGCIIVRTP